MLICCSEINLRIIFCFIWFCSCCFSNQLLHLIYQICWHRISLSKVCRAEYRIDTFMAMTMLPQHYRISTNVLSFITKFQYLRSWYHQRQWASNLEACRKTWGHTQRQGSLQVCLMESFLKTKPLSNSGYQYWEFYRYPALKVWQSISNIQ